MEGERNNNGFYMNNVLAVNRHWHDALLDYAPTKLSIYVNTASDEFIDGVKQENLNGLKYFHLHGSYRKDGLLKIYCPYIMDHMLYPQRAV